MKPTEEPYGSIAEAIRMLANNRGTELTSYTMRALEILGGTLGRHLKEEKAKNE